MMISEILVPSLALWALVKGKLSYAVRNRRLCIEGTVKGKCSPLRTDPYCRMHIMNSHEMDMRAYVPELHRKGLHILRIDGRHMDPHRLRTIVADYVSIQNGTKEAPPKSVGKDDTPITRATILEVFYKRGSTLFNEDVLDFHHIKNNYNNIVVLPLLKN